MKRKIEDKIDSYINKLAGNEANTLQQLRKQITSLIPAVEERLSRGVPFFYYRGKRDVGFRSSQKHLSFFIMEGNALKNMQPALAHYDHSTTVIRFTPDRLI